ncbi:protein of unknown function [Agromyces sp. CF514]|uniref:WxL protein peptidoglycan domain-containing protein n=1 Tax=Agromyces sp. CF514 TaxID=1881031 RepID=UPI0008E7FD98|nr:DUF916 domain-containing protein [Agromyces sp. CF514]SFR70529.1 protein of unknown function [Agromyces sp. CF514]
MYELHPSTAARAGRPSPARRMANRSLTALAVMAALAALAGVAAAPAAAADDPVGWGVRTASNALGAERANYAYVLDPGTALEDAIVVTNNDDVAVDLDLSAADGFTTETGVLDLVTSDTPSTAVGAWITLSAMSVHLEAGESAEIPFRVEVPDGIAPGDYSGGIVTSLPVPDASSGVSVDRRLGIRVQLRVGGELAPALAIEDLRVEYSGSVDPFAAGSATVTYTVHNTGNARLAAGQAIAVAGPFGMLRVDAAGLDPLPELLPGDTWDVTATVPGVVPTGLLTATVDLSPRLPAEGSTTANAPLPPVQATATAWAVPWTLLVLALVLATAAILVVVQRRRRKRREAARIDAAVADALQQREAERTPVA